MKISRQDIRDSDAWLDLIHIARMDLLNELARTRGAERYEIADQLAGLQDIVNRLEEEMSAPNVNSRSP